MKKCSVIALQLLLLTGCAFAPVHQTPYDLYFNQFSRENTVDMASGATLDAVKATLLAMGYEIQAVTPELGTILTKVRQVPIPVQCDCGSWNGAVVNGTADSAFQVTVSKIGEGQSRIVIDQTCGTVFNGQNLYGATTRHEVYRCASRGIIERNFWDTLGKIQAARLQTLAQ